MRTYVINSRKIMEKTVMVIASAITITLIFYSGITQTAIKGIMNYGKNTGIISSAFPIIGGNENKPPSGITGILKLLINEDLDNPQRVSLSSIPFFYTVKDKLSEAYTDINESGGILPKIFHRDKPFQASDIPAPPENAYRAIETHNDSIIKNGNPLQQKGITVKNQTNFRIDLQSLYEQPVGIKYLNGGIQVLIVHTHGSESYNPDDRSQDTEKNVVRVGSEMTKVFEKNNIGVIHSTVMHDIPRYNSSYRKSLETITAELDKHEGINIVLDVHRDAMITDNGDSYKTVCELDGKTAAQVMFVVGTNGGGLQHDNWKENLKLAMKFQEAVNKRCPNLARPINLRTERFNQQMTTGSLIIEVGTNGNTLDEAVRAGVAAAEAIAGVIKEL